MFSKILVQKHGRTDLVWNKSYKGNQADAIWILCRQNILLLVPNHIGPRATSGPRIITLQPCLTLSLIWFTWNGVLISHHMELDPYLPGHTTYVAKKLNKILLFCFSLSLKFFQCCVAFWDSWGFINRDWTCVVNSTQLIMMSNVNPKE